MDVRASADEHVVEPALQRFIIAADAHRDIEHERPRRSVPVRRDRDEGKDSGCFDDENVNAALPMP